MNCFSWYTRWDGGGNGIFQVHELLKIRSCLASIKLSDWELFKLHSFDQKLKILQNGWVRYIKRKETRPKDFMGYQVSSSELLRFWNRFLSQLMPNRQGSRTSIFELGPKERFDMIKEVNDHRQTINRKRKMKRSAVIGPGNGSIDWLALTSMSISQ